MTSYEKKYAMCLNQIELFNEQLQKNEWYPIMALKHIEQLQGEMWCVSFN